MNSSDLIYIPLRIHSEYSITNGIIKLPELLARCQAQQIPALALTDQSNMFAAIKFYQQAIAAGIKPILGCDLWIYEDQHPLQPFRVTLLAQHREGYHNLLGLISDSYLHAQKHGLPQLDYSLITKYSSGLIALSGGTDSDLLTAYQLRRLEPQRWQQVRDFWLSQFAGRYYLELMRTEPPATQPNATLDHQETLLQTTLTLASECRLPVVATNLACFLDAEDYQAHEIRVCINAGTVLNDSKRERKYTPQHRLLAPQEMQQLFSDLPEALTNSIEIAKRCNLELELNKLFLPIFTLPTHAEGTSAATAVAATPEEYLVQQANLGFQQRLLPAILQDPVQRSRYQQRLDYELEIIIKMGFASYFLIVADFINWAKTHGVPVGPGRGSGAGSLVAYTIRITDLDPIRYDLLFERFLNPERVSMPDFDVDFCMEGRDRVIEYVGEHYGREKVSQIITYGTMAAKAVVRDVGRVLGYPYGFVDKIAKLIPFTLGITLQQALESEELLRQRYEEDNDVRQLIDLARKLEGIVRNVGKHAGGIVIAPSALTDFVPLYCEADGSGVISQFDKNDVATVGLVKFDFLGLRTLTIINLAQQLINAQRQQTGQPPLKIEEIPIDDAETFQLIASAQTTGVFQLDSKMAKDVIKRYLPDCFEDIIALVAVIRPGVLQSGMLGDMIDRKHGLQQTHYLHPLLEPILRSTYGIAVYQEQVMQIAQQLAGYTLGGADLLRRTISKKKHAEMVKHRALFLQGAQAKGIGEPLATQIFDQMEKFASYGFNKSHSAAYALITYQTAWLKTHYFAEFMAAILSVDMDHVDKLETVLIELKSRHLALMLPNINRSACRFVVQDGAIVYGLGAIKGVGRAIAEYIVSVRQANGPFQSFLDFCMRVDRSKAHRNILEALIKSGCFDDFGVNRATLLANLADAMLLAEKHCATAHTGQLDLLAELDTEVNDKSTALANHDDQHQELDYHYKPLPEFPPLKKIQLEKDLLGGYISFHPLDLYRQELQQLASIDFVKLQQTAAKNIRIAGLATHLRNILTRNNRNIGMLTVDGAPGSIEVTLFGEQLSKIKRLELNQVLLLDGDTVWDDFSDSYRFKAKNFITLVQAREQLARQLIIRLRQPLQRTEVQALGQLLQQAHGHCPVVVYYHRGVAWTKLRLGEQYSVNPQDELLHALKQRFQIQQIEVEVMYHEH